MSFKERSTDYDPQQIKAELSKFINLLQNDSNTHKPDLKPSLAQTLTKKLSVIMSASQPQSSSIDKQNSNPSANRSFSSGEKFDRLDLNLIKTLQSTGLTPMQSKLVDQIKQMIQNIFKAVESKQTKLVALRQQLDQEKKGTDELLAILHKLDKQDKELWNNYHSLSQKHQELVNNHKHTLNSIESYNEKIVELEKDNDFMKKLIFHANQNYEALEKRCLELQSEKRSTSKQHTDRRQAKKSSYSNLLQKSATTKKNSHSPSRSQIDHSPRKQERKKQEYAEIYRKMIVRTLKYKGRKPQ